MSHCGRQSPTMIPASTMFSVSRERLFCPIVAVRNRTLSPAPGSCIWASENLKFWQVRSAVSFSDFQDFSFPARSSPRDPAPTRRTRRRRHHNRDAGNTPRGPGEVALLWPTVAPPSGSFRVSMLRPRRPAPPHRRRESRQFGNGSAAIKGQLVEHI
jgi:hypothetical protein